MEKISEPEMLSILSKAKKVLLLEPTKGRYVPLGLAKIATFVRRNGGEVEFSSSGNGYDLVAMSALFTYDSASYRRAVVNAGVLFGDGIPVLAGGVCASLTPRLLEDKEAAGFGRGKLLVFQGFSPELDLCVPDYSINWGDRDGWEKYCYSFTSRGCPNHCAYCAVPRLEKTSGGVVVTPNWHDHLSNDRRTCVILDNNLTAAPGDHMKDVIDFLIDNNKTVIFENGIDYKYVTPEKAELLGRVKWAWNGLRIAFDRTSEDGVFQDAIRLLLENGVGRRKIMSYVLFNFTDTPRDAEYRLMECAHLGVQPYPQKLVPLNRPDRKNPYVGKHWTKPLANAFAHFGIMGKFRVKGTRDELVSFSDFVQRADIKKRFGLSDEDLDSLKAT